MINSKINIGIIFGGNSEEHEVSIKSAQTISKALKTKNNKEKYEVIPFYIDKNGHWRGTSISSQMITMNNNKALNIDSDENNPSIFSSLPQSSEKVSIWFPVLHGRNGEDGTIQGLLELIGKPYVGSGVLGSALGMDKIAMKAAFKAAKLPQVPYLWFSDIDIKNTTFIESLINKVEVEVGFPCFIKPANSGSSVGITKAYNENQFLEGLQIAYSIDKRIVIEKSVIARELECGVLGKKKMKTSLVGEIRFSADWYDYKTKYSNDTSNSIIPSLIPDDISQQVRNLSIKACEAICAHSIARVDFFYHEQTNNLWINEINTLPGFTEKSMFPTLWEKSGLNLESLVSEIVETAKIK